MRVRGLKRVVSYDRPAIIASHPVRVRGLKLGRLNEDARDAESHPVRVRGLKPASDLGCVRSHCVAPRAGAWVETPRGRHGAPDILGRTPCGCVG